MDLRIRTQIIICFVSITLAVPTLVIAHGEEDHDTNDATTVNQSEVRNTTGNETPLKKTHQKTYRSDRADSPPLQVSRLKDNSVYSGDHNSGEKSGLLNTLLPGFANAPNVHPMFVHFPIVLFWVATLFSIISWKWNPEQFLKFARWSFWLGLIALPVTAGTGFLAVGGWGGGHVTSHRNLMLISTGLAFGLFGILKFVSGRARLHKIILTVGLIIVTIFISLGADRGAWLVYVKGSGVQSSGHTHTHH